MLFGCQGNLGEKYFLRFLWYFFSVPSGGSFPKNQKFNGVADFSVS